MPRKSPLFQRLGRGGGAQLLKFFHVGNRRLLAIAAGDGVVQLRKIEACKDIAETLAKSRSVVYLPGGNGGGGGSNILLGVNAGQ